MKQLENTTDDYVHYSETTELISQSLLTKVSELKYTNKLLINKERNVLKGYNNG